MTNATDYLAEKPAPLPTHARSVMIYTRYERFWHWSQALLIFFLIFTGFVVHGTFGLLSFGTAVSWHTTAGLTLSVLWLFTIFWQLTTGQWHHYAPRRAGVFAMIRYYSWGILSGAPHPFHKTLKRKQNPLQTWAYLWFVLGVGPALWVSGFAYLLYPVWARTFPTVGLGLIAFVHTAAAFCLLVFVIAHVYIATTGRTPGDYIKTMITGYDDIEVDAVEETFLETHHGHIR
jgi:thiosulfate reductase cytochrome b subunit